MIRNLSEINKKTFITAEELSGIMNAFAHSFYNYARIIAQKFIMSTII